MTLTIDIHRPVQSPTIIQRPGVSHFELEFGDKNIITVHYDDGDVEYIEGTGITVTRGVSK